MIVALAGQKRCGKDTAAVALVADGFTKVAFADSLRDAAAALDPIIGNQPGYGLVRLSDAFSEGWGWESLKRSPYADEVRRLLQRMGTEVGRQVLGADTWVNATAHTIDREPGTGWVITDCRFANEAEWVRGRGGIVVHIQRPATDDPNPVHPSEVIDFECDHVLVNDGTPDDLRDALRALVGRAGQ